MDGQKQVITLNKIELQVAATSNGRRVTRDEVKGSIAEVHYFTAAQAIIGMDEAQPRHPSLSTLTICVAVMTNGFTAVGKAPCIDPANYVREIGEQIALEDAIRQLWDILGWQLRERIHQESMQGTGTNPAEEDPVRHPAA